MTTKVLVPRLMDEDNFNPQNSNAQNLLLRFSDKDLCFITMYYNQPRRDIANNSQVRMCKLWRRRFWKVSVWMAYQKSLDAIFYPGADIFDDLGWRFRDCTGRRLPIIATLEGLVGNQEREREYTDWAGHAVYCQQVNESTLARIDRLYQRADHVIAISPFLANMGRRRYGDKFSIIPLGIDSTVFFSNDAVKYERVTVISAGRLYANKRPEVFVELASRFPEADFIWYGWGELLETLQSEVSRLGLDNLAFPGPVTSVELAEAMRNAHIFVLPSKSEGVPKVTQEAAACGLPVVLFGFYEAPSVIDGENGYVVWDDSSFFECIETLLTSHDLRRTMGSRGEHMSRELSWDAIAVQWKQTVKQIVDLSA